MTDIVVDSNLIAAIAIPLPYSDAAQKLIAEWKKAGFVIGGPVLWEYEFTTVLRRAQYHGLLTMEQMARALQRVSILNIQSLLPSDGLHRSALFWAERLKQSRAYDAQYLALAEELSAEFWTGDKRLANGARSLGINWVHWVGEG